MQALVITSYSIHYTKLYDYATPAKQKEVLLRNGIYFIEGKGGKIRTTSENLRNPIGTRTRGQLPGANDGFNLEAI